MISAGVKLSELLVALSLATDLGLGQPFEHMLRSARISMRLGGRLGLGPRDLATLYDVSILTYVGCPVYGNEAALLFGDDIDFRAGTYAVDLGGSSGRAYMLRRVGAHTPPLHRVRQAASLVATGGRGVVEQMASHCSAAGVLAERLGLSEDVQAGVAQSYARWDGHGVPGDLAGDGLALVARISHVADACEVLQRTLGVGQAVEVVTARSGGHFDPEIVRAVRQDAAGLFTGIERDTVDEVLDAEPVAHPPLSEDGLDTALEAIGDFGDLRCTFFAGHARATAALVTGAAAHLQLPPDETRLARRAALVRDVGRSGIPASLWGKPGPLSDHEWERVRMHGYYTERIFSRPEPVRRIGLLAGTHHERIDGSGYHRGTTRPVLSVPARVLAAADAYAAMLQPRPHRAARSPAEAAAVLRREVREGRLDPVATDAVLAAAGARGPGPSSARPHGLTVREAEVLTLLARGLPNKSIGRHLHITAKTVSNHVEHIYAKLGVSSRVAAALTAMQHDLLGPEPPS